MKTYIVLIFACVSLVVLNPMYGQPFAYLLDQPKSSFFEIQQAFNTFWQDKTPYKGSGYNQYKRWEWYWETRINDDGTFPPADIVFTEWERYMEQEEVSGFRSADQASWVIMGPITAPGGYRGLGRVNCIAFHPTDVNTFWIGTPAGGLWKTSNGGQTWIAQTDQLPTLGVTDIAVDHRNPNIIYLATGDGNLGSLSALTGGSHGDTKSIGVIKTTNGGQTWSSTGLNWTLQESQLLNRLLIHPTNTQILLTAGSSGIWRTSNGGNTWTNVQVGHFTDLEFKPGNPDIVYASTFSFDGLTAIYRSTNGGQTWSVVANLSNVVRMNIAVTPASPDLVDVVCTNTQGGLASLIYSNNSGQSFQSYFQADCSNNLLTWEYNAAGCSGQGYYDLAYAINPTDANDIWLGGINTWNSKDGGSTWRLNNFWIEDHQLNPNRIPVVHADKHMIAFHPLDPNRMFECNDGGIYVSNDRGQTWTFIGNGLGISQIYRIGVSQTIPNNIICGLQDNGTKEIYNNQWYDQTGGDGMECIIDPVNADIEYASYANGVIYRTFDFWKNNVTISRNIPGGQPQGAWVTPFVLDPQNPQVIYAGYNVLYRSLNRGNSWQQISPVLSNHFLRSIAVAPSSSFHIYTASLDTLFFTRNGGSNWFFVPNTIPNTKISYIVVHPSDPLTVWITLTGYQNGQKVYKSTDGGINWTNVSGSLPNVSALCLVYQKGSNNRLYVGTELGVFYRDDNMNDWARFQNGLPNVPVTELEISYQDRRIWAATYGRGLWRSGLVEFSTGTYHQNEEEEVKIKAWPNPASDFLYIDNEKGQWSSLEILDLQGKNIIKQSIENHRQLPISVGHLPHSVYILQVTNPALKTQSQIRVILGQH